MQSPKAGVHCCVLTGRKGAGEGIGRGHPRGREATGEDFGFYSK